MNEGLGELRCRRHFLVNLGLEFLEFPPKTLNPDKGEYQWTFPL